MRRRFLTIILPVILLLGSSGIFISCEQQVPEIVDLSVEDKTYDGSIGTRPEESGSSAEDRETKPMYTASLIEPDEEIRRSEEKSREEAAMRTDGTDISNGEQEKLPTALPTHPEPRYSTEESTEEDASETETPSEESISSDNAETPPVPDTPENQETPDAGSADETPAPESQTPPADPGASGGYPFPTQSVAELNARKAVYLTFDDGPSAETTPYVLDVLDQYGVKACFFVTYQPHLENLYREIVNRGHSIGIHTASHRYDQIYASFDNWYNDYMAAFNYVIQVTGYTPNLYRFPGGSNQTYSSGEVKAQIIAWLHSHGVEYFDWNVSTEDAVGNKTPQQALEMAMSQFTYRKLPVILMHDGQNQAVTATMLPALIENIRSLGYTFMRLDATVPPIQQGKHWDY
ncbi:MAG: polysaccharide deacetylase family protein [Lachnospiraceae bacterium]|nr:polysaccharide deacetylase family protein [Lachnospiraceae bacterium]